MPDSLPPGLTLEMLSVVADAVTTPYEAITRAEVGADDLVIVVGAGGIGGFGVQIAAAFGAAANSAGVTRFTRTSVHCADSTTATSN